MERPGEAGHLIFFAPENFRGGFRNEIRQRQQKNSLPGSRGENVNGKAIRLSGYE